MKQFIVLCAVLPLMLVLMLQFSKDQINSYKINAVNQCVYAAKEQAQQEGYFSNEIKKRLCDELAAIGFSGEVVIAEFDNFTAAQDRGTILRYKVSVRIDDAMVGIMVKDNSYYYTIDTCTVSEFIPE